MLIRLFTASLLVSAVTLAVAQMPPNYTRVYGNSDRDLPTPKHSAKATTDGVALQKVLNFVKMSGTSGWQGMTADGSISYAGDAKTYPAHIAVLGSDCYRLDIEKAGGKESTVINGERGAFLSVEGKHRSVSTDISALGLLAFPKLLSSKYPSPTSVLTDQGTTTIAGKPLSRITLDDPAIDPTGTPWKTEDLYFDPETGKLVESAALVHLSTADNAMYMLVVNYDDYRDAGGGILPYSLTQSLNGTAVWTLKLNNISLTSLPSPSIFKF